MGRIEVIGVGEDVTILHEQVLLSHSTRNAFLAEHHGVKKRIDVCQSTRVQHLQLCGLDSIRRDVSRFTTVLSH